MTLENESGVIDAVDDSIIEEEKPSQEQEENADGEQVKKKRPSGFHRKISKLEQQNADLAAQLAALSQPAKLDSSKPNIDDFTTYDEFNEALTDWKVEQKLSQREVEAVKKKEQEERAVKQREVEQTWESKLDSLDETYDDYDDVVGKYKDTRVRQEIMQATFESDIGPQIRYYLAKNPDVLAKFNNDSTSSYAIFKEIAKIEDQLNQKPKVKITNAPDPITPVKRGGTSTVSLADLDTESYLAQRLNRKK